MINNFLFTDVPYSVVVSKGAHGSLKLVCVTFNVPSLSNDRSKSATLNMFVYPRDRTVCWELWLLQLIHTVYHQPGKEHDFKYSLYQMRIVFVLS